MVPRVKLKAAEERYEQGKMPFSKLMEIRERAIANGMPLLTQDEVLEEVKNRRTGMSKEKNRDNELNYKRIIVHDRTYFWAEGASATSVYDEVKQLLFTIPFFAQERDVRMALFGYLQCALLQFIHETRKGETE